MLTANHANNRSRPPSPYPSTHTPPQEIRALHFSDARAFAGAVKWRVVTGDTLLFDYIFFTHPTAIGHWWEMIAPLYRCA